MGLGPRQLRHPRRAWVAPVRACARHSFIHAELPSTVRAAPRRTAREVCYVSDRPVSLQDRDQLGIAEVLIPAPARRLLASPLNGLMAPLRGVEIGPGRPRPSRRPGLPAPAPGRAGCARRAARRQPRSGRTRRSAVAGNTAPGGAGRPGRAAAAVPPMDGSTSPPGRTASRKLIPSFARRGSHCGERAPGSEPLTRVPSSPHAKQRAVNAARKLDLAQSP
jgi:hypothetical protein